MIRASFFSQNLFKERREWIARGEGKPFNLSYFLSKRKTFLLKRIVFNVKKHAQNWEFTDKKAVGKLELFVSKIKIFYNIYNSEANWQNC